MRYAWNRGRSVDAQEFGETVERLSDENGGVCPAWAVVDEARPSVSPLHPLFEWDDLTAAEAFRREQARHHLRELRIVQETDEGETKVQAFVHIVRLDGDRPVEGYRLTSLVVQSVDECKQMLDEALAGLRAWRRRYEHLSELADVVNDVGQVIARRG
ncbi:MAG TPA: hypothetical protein VIG24_11015 [Acidimicrobiia bacterium]